MDDKVTVGEAVVAGYRFGFGRLGAVIGAAWLPMLVMTVLLTLIGYLMSGSTPGALAAKTPGTALGGVIGMAPLSVLVQAVFEGMAVSGVMAIALGRRQPGFAYFSFGPAALRMIAAYVVMNLIVAGLVAVLLAMLVGATFALGMPSPPAEAGWIGWLTYPLRNTMMCMIAPSLCPSPAVVIGIVIFGLAELTAFVYVMVRLTFFLPAVVVAEEQIKFGRAWSLSRGNFWRVFAIWLGVIVPAAIAVAIVQHYATKLMIPTNIAGAPHDTQGISLALQGMPVALIVMSLIAMIDRIVTVGLEAGAQAKAYNELTMSDAPSVF